MVISFIVSEYEYNQYNQVHSEHHKGNSELPKNISVPLNTTNITKMEKPKEVPVVVEEHPIGYYLEKEKHEKKHHNKHKKDKKQHEIFSAEIAGLLEAEAPVELHPTMKRPKVDKSEIKIEPS